MGTTWADMERTWTPVWTLGYGSLALWLVIYMTTVRSEQANFAKQLLLPEPLLEDNDDDDQLVE